jgi:hypothetical protein
MTVVTSKISPVSIGQGRNRETIYTATRTTKLADGTYSVEMLQYSDAKGTSGKVIAERESVNNWDFKDGVSNKIKQNEGRLNEASKTQMESMRGDFVTKSQETEEYNRAQGQPNKATSDENQDSQPAGVSRSVADRADTRKSFPDCVYPLDLAQTKQDVIKFTMLEYIPQDFNQGGQFGFSNEARKQGNRNSIGTVILPIPGGIQDTNSVSWSGQNMNALQAGLANVALNTIERGVEGATQSITNVKNAIVANAGEGKTAVAQLFAGAASGTGTQLLTRTTGAVINPNLELLFSGPALRTFSFQFKLNARERRESEEIVKILRFFKQGSAAQKSKSHLFLKSPHTFQIQYLHRGPDGDENPFMNKIKECALQSVSVNYTPEGNYATFDDGAMTSYELTLQFSELEPVFNNDYDIDNDTSIGF